MAAEFLMNRCRGLAEGVVVMICPMLLTLALNKVDLNGKGIPIAMIAFAGVTLIIGICPLLACCLTTRGFPGVPLIASLATICCSCLLILACLTALRIVSKSMAIPFAVLCGIFVLLRTVNYYGTQNAENYTEVMHNILDESHEFLTAVTGILFLGFEGLALEDHGRQMAEKMPVGTSFIFCAIGVCLMFLEMTPPPYFTRPEQIAWFTFILDSIMALGTFALLLSVMFKIMQEFALLLFLPPVFIAVHLVFHVAVVTSQPRVVTVIHDQQVPLKFMPASLELTKVTFTGFIAVSVAAISNALPSKFTAWFLLCAAAAIVFDLSWRFLSQMHIRRILNEHVHHVASTANLASFCAHLCIVVATILFIGMAGKAIWK